ncbi:alpha/beta hydrolase family protein [Salinicoccus halodurans]|nr:S9 family peptidase [Salinicoccus halodurans]SFK65097.1 Dipeptidyl aminopeptidase/acylaminoacyl peptidase [Salinicoccus halodurans]
MKNKVKIEDIYTIRSVSSPSVVPGTDAVTYLETSIDEEKNDYRTNLCRCQDGEAQQLTYQHERISNVRHSPDGKRTLFLAKTEDRKQVFMLRSDGGEREQLTEEEDDVNSAEFSKDGQSVYFHVSIEKGKAEKEDEEKDGKDERPEPVVIDRMKYKADSLGLLKEKYQSVKTIDIKSRAVETLLSGEENFSLMETIGDDTIVYTTDHSDEPDFNFSQKLYIRHGENEAEEIKFGEGGVMDAAVSPDGTKLLITVMGREFENATHGVIMLYDTASGTLENLTGKLDKPVGDYMAADTQQSVETTPVKWISNERFVFVLSENGSVNLYGGNTKGEVTSLLSGRHHVFGMDATEDYAVLAISAHDSPGELYKFDFDSGTLEALTDINKEYVEKTLLVDPEDVRFESRDGTEVHGWFMKPAGFEDGGKYPMITNIHGGPHAFYGNTFFHEMQVLASLGYAVLFVNPRGSHSYSQAFVDAVRGNYGGIDYEDIMAGVDYITDKYDWIDRDNLGVTGGSYGGFMTNWIVGHTDRFKAAVTQRSICNWVSFRGVSDIGYYFSDWQIKADFNDIETMWHHSPIKYVDDIHTPLLILHSERDFRCPIEQAEQLYIALKYQKKETQFVRFPDADHNLSRTGKPNLRVERLNHLAGWFARHLD